MTEPQPPAAETDDWQAPRNAWNTYSAKKGLDHGVASWCSDHARTAFMTGYQVASDRAKTQLVTIAKERDQLMERLGRLSSELDDLREAHYG